MKLYKYLSFDFAVRLLKQGAVRFAPPTAFNDPFELHPSFDLMSKEDIQKLPDDPNNPGQKLISPETMQEVCAALGPGIQRAMAKYSGCLDNMPCGITKLPNTLWIAYSAFYV